MGSEYILGANQYINKGGIIVNAIQWTGFNTAEVRDFLGLSYNIQQDKAFNPNHCDYIYVSNYIVESCGMYYPCFEGVFGRDYTLLGTND